MLLTALALLAACSSDQASSPSPTTKATTVVTSTTQGGQEARLDATYGCGPADGAQVTVRGWDVGTSDVVIEVAFDETVYDRSWPMAGPRVGEVFDTKLPQEAWEAGAADVRIVRADDRSDVIVAGEVRLDGGVSCG